MILLKYNCCTQLCNSSATASLFFTIGDGCGTNELDRQLMASCITSFNYSLVSQVVLSMAKKIHLVMSSWFLIVNVVMTNSCANATNSNAKLTNSIAKPTNSTADGTNSITKTGVTNHWTGLLDWNTGLDYWTDIFLVFTHSEVGFIESC